MFVYIDGEYQCNRGRNNLKVPTSTTQKHHTNVDFVVRQKEETISDGNFLGRQWIFGGLEGDVPQSNLGSSHSVLIGEHMATIEVVVLRSLELQRPKAPMPSVSELHPIVFNKPDTPNPSSSKSAYLSNPDEDTEMSDFGGLFDGTSDIREPHVVQMPFGGDMAWDDDEQQNRGQHFSTDWRGGSQQHNAHKSGGSARSRAPSRSSSIPAASPAVQIFVNQPAASAPDWSAPEPSQWRRAPGSIADSWGTPAQGSQEGGKSRDRPPKDATQNMSAAWDAATKEKQPQSGGYGWNNSGGGPADRNARNSNQQDNNGWNVSTAQDTGGQNNNHGWGNNEASNTQQDTGWDGGNNDENDQVNWDSNGQDDTANNDWGGGNNGGEAYDNNGDNTGWDTGQNDQTNQDASGQNGGAWNADDGNDQGNSGWDNTGQNESQHYNNYGGNAHSSGDAWNNANAGAQETQALNANNWNASTTNQNAWGQNGGANDSLPATTGVLDPAKTRSRKPSASRAKSVKGNLSRQATMNSVAQKSGQKHSNSVQGNGGEFGQPWQQQCGLPGAWPDTSQNGVGQIPFQSGLAAGIKPYHVIPDAAGNPRLPTITPISPITEAPAPTPPPVKLAETPQHVHRGSPALYQHKTASPRYIDTHDRPYASFIFKYRPKPVIEQMLNLTIADSDDMEKAKLAHLSKEELIEQVIKTKSQLGSKMSSTISSLSAMPPSVNNFANGGNGNWGANQDGGNTNQQNNNHNGWKTNSGGNYGNHNTTSSPAGGAFGAQLSGKLAALTGQNNGSNSSSGGSNNNQGWNNVPPGSPLANKGNANIGGPSNNQAGVRGGRIDTWLSKTPMGASVSGHKPWNGVASVKNSGGSNPGGNTNNWGANPTNNGASGGWNGSNKGNIGDNTGNVSRARSQKGKAKSQNSGGWNKDNSGGDGGWHGDGNKNGGGGGQTNDWGNGNNNNNGGAGWNGSNDQSGNQANHWGNGNGGGGWDNNNGNGNHQQATANIRW
ncbi:MAG: hypothetical protein LQ337_000819 [Flavoplaca oasis]|nr:MAG: hypothetical protein LQ337_000819 [Flavoplaca oasis]